MSSRGYDDNLSNISKPNSSAASDEDDIGDLENLEPNSPDPDYTYFGEISLTDLYSMPGFRKDLHEEVPDQGYCPLYVADSNLCQYPELLPKGNELGTFSAGRVLPNRRIEDVYGEILPKQPDTCFSKYTFFILELGYAIDFFDHHSKCCHFKMAYANDGLSFMEANVRLTVTEGELAFYTKESGLEKYEECVWEYDEVGLYWYLNKNQLPSHIFVQASVFYPNTTNEAFMQENYAKLKWTAEAELYVNQNGQPEPGIEVDNEPETETIIGVGDKEEKKVKKMDRDDMRNAKKKSKDDGTFGGSKVISSIFLRKAACGREFILVSEYEFFIEIIKQGVSLLKSPRNTSALRALTSKRVHHQQEVIFYIVFQLEVSILIKRL